MRDGFIIHEKTLKQMARLSPEDTKYLMECLTTYYSTGEIDIDKVQETSIVVAVILDDAIERMDLDKQGYEKSVEQRREAARKRWGKEQKNADNAEGIRDDATACDRIQPQCESDAGNAVSVSVSVSDSGIKEKGILTDTQKESPAKVEHLMPAAREIIAYLNEKTNSKYSATSKNTVKLIKARMKEGHTIDDFKKVIDIKSAQWAGDPKMEDYLRPNTLFAESHFDDYLNQKGGKGSEEKPPDRRFTTPDQKKGKFFNFPQRDDEESKANIQKVINMQLAGGA